MSISLTMHNVVFLLAHLSFTGHCRRLQTLSVPSESSSRSDPSGGFLSLLLASSHSAGFQPSGPALMHRKNQHGLHLPTSLSSDRPRRWHREALKMQAVVDDLQSMKVPDLKTMLKARGLKVSGKKAELIARLSEATADEKVPEDEQTESEAEAALTASEHVAKPTDLSRQDTDEAAQHVYEDASEVAQSEGPVSMIPQSTPEGDDEDTEEALQHVYEDASETTQPEEEDASEATVSMIPQSASDVDDEDAMKVSQFAEGDASDLAESVEEDKPKGTIFVMPTAGDYSDQDFSNGPRSLAERHGMTHALEEQPVLRVGAASQALPPPDRSMVKEGKLQKVRYMGATDTPTQCPDMGNLPEIAFFGRSNVGKSSLLNMMTFQKGNATVSAKPGTTQRIHHYLINNQWWLVDLPGYGFAKATAEETQKWGEFTDDYFANRSTLAGVFLLIDSSIPPQELDFEKIDFLIEHGVPFIIIFTKSDRHKEGLPTPLENQANVKERLMERWQSLPTMIATSIYNNTGRKEVLEFLSSIVQFCRHRTKLAKKERRRQRVLLDPDKKTRAAQAADGSMPQALRDLWWGQSLQRTSERFRCRSWNQNWDQGWDGSWGRGRSTEDRRGGRGMTWPDGEPRQEEQDQGGHHREGGHDRHRRQDTWDHADRRFSQHGQPRQEEGDQRGHYSEGRHDRHSRQDSWDHVDQRVPRHGQQWGHHSEGRQDRHSRQDPWEHGDQRVPRYGQNRREDRQDHGGYRQTRWGSDYTRNEFRDHQRGDYSKNKDLEDEDEDEQGYYAEAMQRHKHFDAGFRAKIDRQGSSHLDDEDNDQGDRTPRPRLPEKNDFYAQALKRYAEKKAARSSTGNNNQAKEESMGRSHSLSGRH
mmetsp:Transcript_53189/g.99741  ORF Transcript_53189/g.99741 Transcript_53189/m.99741 type:complete len:872 (-) Transcript_53189:215-2830(-)